MNRSLSGTQKCGTAIQVIGEPSLFFSLLSFSSLASLTFSSLLRSLLRSRSLTRSLSLASFSFHFFLSLSSPLLLCHTKPQNGLFVATAWKPCPFFAERARIYLAHSQMQQTTQGDTLNNMECKLKMNHFIERKWRFF